MIDHDSSCCVRCRTAARRLGAARRGPVPPVTFATDPARWLWYAAAVAVPVLYLALGGTGYSAGFVVTAAVCGLVWAFHATRGDCGGPP